MKNSFKGRCNTIDNRMDKLHRTMECYQIERGVGVGMMEYILQYERWSKDGIRDQSMAYTRADET